jgi:hypothetical protein
VGKPVASGTELIVAALTQPDATHEAIKMEDDFMILGFWTR